MSTVDVNYLYHGLIDSDLPELLDHGMPPPSHWFLYELAEFWAWVRHYHDGGHPAVLRVPLDRFDPTKLRPDETACDHPLMLAFQAQEGHIESLRERARAICRYALSLCGGVIYEDQIMISTNDVIFVEGEDD